MHTHQATALWTRPSLLFSCNKPVKPDLANRLKVFEHTHAILGLVTLVELLQPLAWEHLTITAERQIASRQLFTVLDTTNNAIVGLASIISATSRTLFLGSEIPTAQTAIHPARRNEGRYQKIWSSHLTLGHAITSPQLSNWISFLVSNAAALIANP